jgi:hypothetical protein
MSEETRVKAPTITDMKILRYLQTTGLKLNHLDALQLFKTTGIRDCIYRLSQAGHDIKRETVYYKTADGRTKHYVNYFVEGADTGWTPVKMD